MVDRISVLGTGLMGAPIARNLARSGFAVSAWNRTAAKAAALVPDGVTVASSARASVADADLVVVLLSDGPATNRLLFDPGDGIAEVMRPDAILAMMSSIAPDTARVQAERLKTGNIGYIDAPVSGGERGAIARKLTIFAGGPVATIDAVSPALAVLGRINRVGPVGTGQLIKLANQMIVGTTITAIAEALLMIERGGGDSQAAFTALEGGFADSAVLRQQGARMLREDFAPGATVATQLKDLRMAAAMADQQRLSLPLLTAVEAMFATAAAGGDRELDHSAIVRTLRTAQPQPVPEPAI